MFRALRTPSIRFVVCLFAASTTVALAPLPAYAKGGTSGESEKLQFRTTDEGVALRVYRSRYEAPVVYAGNVRVPASCFPDQMITVGVSTRRVAESIQTSWRTDTLTRSSAMTQIVGSELRAPVGIVVVPAPARAVRARAQFASGVSDETEIADGWAVLAARLPRRQFDSRGVRFRGTLATVKLLDRDGNVIRTVDANPDSMRGFVIGNEPECNLSSSGVITPAPVNLPEPTGPPPADEAGAREAVTTVYEAAYSAGGDADKALTYVEDGDTEEVRAAQRAAGERSTQYRGRVTGKVTEVKFLNDHEAGVRFDLKVDGDQPLLTGRVGRAVLVNGEWKVARSSYCELLSMGGGGVRC